MGIQNYVFVKQNITMSKWQQTLNYKNLHEPILGDIVAPFIDSHHHFQKRVGSVYLNTE